MAIRLGKNEQAYQLCIKIIVVLVAITALFPLIYVVGMSLTTQTELLQKNYFVIIPENPTLEAYRRILFAAGTIPRAFGYSVYKTIVGTALSIAATYVTGYILAQKYLVGRKFFMAMVLITMLFGGGLVPSYLLIKSLGMIDSYASLIIPPALTGFNVFVLRMAVENIPQSLVESAELDGAGDISMMCLIAMPLILPSLAAITMFTVVGQWNSWFDAMLYIQDQSKYPLQLVLQKMLTGIQGYNDTMQAQLAEGATTTNEAMKMASVIVGTVPILAIYPLFQKYFIHGMYMGAVKG